MTKSILLGSACTLVGRIKVELTQLLQQTIKQSLVNVSHWRVFQIPFGGRATVWGNFISVLF